MVTETKQQANPKAIGLPEPKIKDDLSQPGVFCDWYIAKFQQDMKFVVPTL